MVEMSVVGVAIEASGQNPILFLRDPSGLRQVPIVIDHAQAMNILGGLKKTNSKKPLSHDLMLSLLNAGNLVLERIIINSIEGTTYQATLQLLSRDKTDNINTKIPKIQIKAKACDAIALALRTRCSIWMLEEIVANNSIPVDAIAYADDQEEFHQFIDKLNPAALINNLKILKQDNDKQIRDYDNLKDNI